MCVNVEMKYCKPGMYSTPSGLNTIIFCRSTGFTGGYSRSAPSEQFGNWNLSQRTTGKIVRRLKILRFPDASGQAVPSLSMTRFVIYWLLRPFDYAQGDNSGHAERSRSIIISICIFQCHYTLRILKKIFPLSMTCFACC
jgi:hypothetical protein